MKVIFTHNDKMLMDFEEEFSSFEDLIKFLDERFSSSQQDWKRSSIETAGEPLPGKTLVGWRYFITDFQNAQEAERINCIDLSCVKERISILNKLEEIGEITEIVAGAGRRILTEKNEYG